MTNEERDRFAMRLDKYTDAKLKIIMKSGLFRDESSAVKAAIVELANRIEAGEFSAEGRKL